MSPIVIRLPVSFVSFPNALIGNPYSLSVDTRQKSSGMTECVDLYEKSSLRQLPVNSSPKIGPVEPART